MVAVVDMASYECEPPRERADGVEWIIRFDSDLSDGGPSGGHVRFSSHVKDANNSARTDEPRCFARLVGLDQ